jgi:hypothetical protein
VYTLYKKINQYIQEIFNKLRINYQPVSSRATFPFLTFIKNKKRYLNRINLGVKSFWRPRRDPKAFLNPLFFVVFVKRKTLKTPENTHLSNNLTK